MPGGIGDAAFDEYHIRAGLDIAVRALEGFTHAATRQCIGARTDDRLRRGTCVDGGADLVHHNIRANQRALPHVCRWYRFLLVLQLDTARPGTFQYLHRAIYIDRIAESLVRIDEYGNVDSVANPADYPCQFRRC